MRFSSLVIPAVVLIIAGCGNETPESAGPEAEVAEVIQPVDLPQSIAECQAQRLEVGMIEFLPSDTAADEFPSYELPANAKFVGILEVDALCLMDDGTLVVYDHQAAGSVLCKAAVSESALLSALAVMQEFYAKNVSEDSFDEAAAIKVRDRCTEIAGGEECRSFFVMLLGV
ncbi:MAG: hypothetical protein HON53_00170 [Planctomycetaceae bacterium]|jgi:hypothetical protein|nr:hypothetical protein [Planctomycetaceae bacterium]MBT6156495.1 hypothetical protein [Planctomycetaceae bacterium]MBT6485427.1 hypothetical protein [Planctomycetaceae bacterium]MBT6497223.1 hypothetical protein [Planctomycetaceae bacterium]